MTCIFILTLLLVSEVVRSYQVVWLALAREITILMSFTKSILHLVNANVHHIKCTIWLQTWEVNWHFQALKTLFQGVSLISL